MLWLRILNWWMIKNVFTQIQIKTILGKIIISKGTKVYINFRIQTQILALLWRQLIVDIFICYIFTRLNVRQIFTQKTQNICMIFIQCWANVGDVGRRRCINVIQMFCVCLASNPDKLADELGWLYSNDPLNNCNVYILKYFFSFQDQPLVVSLFQHIILIHNIIVYFFKFHGLYYYVQSY